MNVEEILICLLIFILSICEIGFYTIRVAMTVRGNKLMVALLAMINNAAAITCIILIVSHFTEKPLRALVYALGTAVGGYMGMIITKKIKGSNFISIIVDRNESDKIIKVLKSKSFDYTIIQGKGREKDRDIFKIPTLSTRKKEILKIVHDTAASAMLIDEVISTQNSLK